MTSAPFIQIHTLTAYPASLLNRDDVGFAKRLPFGGATRTRVSSQCLKRHWRTFEGEGSIRSIEDDGGLIEPSIRSRRTFERYVYDPLVADGIDNESAKAVTQAIMAEVLGQSAKAKITNDDSDVGVRTGQITVLGHPEVRYLRDRAKQLCEEAEGPLDAKKAKAAVKDWLKGDAKKNIQELRHASGLDAALFGRMVTSDILARGDAAIHVAHAFTVHEEESETDYFSAVDELTASSEDDQALGSGHIGSAELTSGLFYGYVVVDVAQLVMNLEGAARDAWRTAPKEVAAEVTGRLMRLMATVSPGAKLGSTAPYSRAHMVLVEAGATQPRTLANAFLRPVDARPNVVENAYNAIARHLGDLDAMYGRNTERRLAALGPSDSLLAAVGISEAEPLDVVAGWAAGRVEGSDG